MGFNGNKNLYNLASRCVFKNYNDIKNIADVNGEFGNHVTDTNNPHNVNRTQVGLGNVTNESKATMFTSPTFTGTVSGITKAMVGLGNVTNVDCTNPGNITQSASYRFVTDSEKSTWNNKSNFSGSYDDLTDIPSGVTQTLTVVTSVNFTTSTTTTSTITFTNGIVTNII